MQGLWNHRGYSMSLRFQSIHRVLTREFLYIRKKIKKTRERTDSYNTKNENYTQIKQKNENKKHKEIGKERIQEAPNDQHKNGQADLIFWHSNHKRVFRILTLSYLQRGLN